MSKYSWYLGGIWVFKALNSVAKAGSISGELGVRTGARRVQSGSSMKPKQMIDCGCEHGKQDMKFNTAMRTKDIGTFAVVARSSTDRADSDNKAKGGVEAHTGVEVDALTTIGVGSVWNVISWVVQSINGLFSANQEYPSTATADRARGVMRNRMVC